MSGLEGQQKQMLAKQGQNYSVGNEKPSMKAPLPELDDLEQLLNVGQTKSAQVMQPVPQDKQAPAYGVKPEEQQP